MWGPLRFLRPDALWARYRFDPTAYGLPRRDELDTGRSGPALPGYRVREIQALADATRHGDWQAAASYVEAAGQDWDTRWSRTELLEQIARPDSSWVDAWRRERPDDCDAATLHALVLVHRAWAIRGSGYANTVPPARMAQFGALLPEAIDAAREAAALAPQNPGPWVVMITAARGARYSPYRFQQLWTELVARAPHHYDGHWQALQFWCAKWAGSDAEMLSFARKAVRNAPEGSPLAAMYLFALQELEAREGKRAPSKDSKALLQQVADSLRSVRADDERLPRLRHLLAYHLGRADLHDAALEQFRLIGLWCGAEPWIEDPNPAMSFDLARTRAARKSAGPRQATRQR
ncbi:hypothetical protein RVR_10215 [Actinacidiphila reveromycinica]|uniref:DUF4034 domain-containing protein n=1 Tax=Actinacidiphila reveromycinica TaxID=659352 RepID=A0A7U3VSY5_9ACTN|nr:hypothetical protein RVR_10215 [Streptomyces sp. SN-593]